MKCEIKFKGFSEEEEGFIHHDFIMLLKEEILQHIEAITDHMVEIDSNGNEDKIMFRKVIDS